MKVVPASGERDSKGRKKSTPRKYKGPFTYKESSPRALRDYVARMLEHQLDKQHGRLIAGEITPEEGTRQLAPLRTLNRIIHNMEEREFKERSERGPSPNDYQGTLF